jgi:hypothetical protein
MSQPITKEKAKELIELRNNSKELQDKLTGAMDTIHNMYKSAIITGHLDVALELSLNQCVDVASVYLGNQHYNTQEEFKEKLDEMIERFGKALMEKVNFFADIVEAMMKEEGDKEDESPPPTDPNKLN